MNFFYPNMQNDMWRIFGLIFFGEKEHFVDAENRRFNQPLIEDFLKDKGIALYDTASAVNRLQNNASDKFLEVVEQTNVGELLRQLPLCTAVVTTGQKAAETLCALFGAEQPTVGNFTTFEFEGRTFHLWRMPSSSRAYPLKIEKKADVYAQMLEHESLLTD